MNKADINQLLSFSNQQISELKSSIEHNNLNKPVLKNTLENLRSVLDYIAKDLYEITEGTSGKVYFPYGERKNHFKKSMSRNLPKLEQKLKRIYQNIEDIQPYKFGNRWLIDLCELTNETKHNNLNKSEKVKNSVQVGDFIKIINSKGVRIINNTVDGKDIGDMVTDENTEITVTRPGQISLEIIHEKEIKFKGRDLDIIPFLTTCHLNLEKLVKDIYREIDI